LKAIAAIATACLLASCNRQNGSICETPGPPNPDDYKTCLHRSAYKFAGSPGANPEIARAVVAQCDPEISHRVMQDMINSTVRGVDWDSYDTQIRKDAEAEALMRVVQARAGRCEVPSDS
jgi:hypothetical protein